MTQDTKKDIIDLDSLAGSKNLPRVQLLGREVVVHRINGKSMFLLAQLSDDASEKEYVEAMYTVVEQALPDLTKDEVLSLVPEQVSAVLALSQGKVQQVENKLEELQGNSGASTESPQPSS